MSPRPGRPYLLLLPGLIILGLLFMGGMVLAVHQSLGGFPGNATGLTLQHYRSVFQSKEFWSGLSLTFYLSGTATVISCTLGLLLAVGLARAGSRWQSLFARLPLVVPHTVAAYLALIWLSQSGLLARFAFLVGLISEPRAFPALVNDPSSLGIIITYVWKEAPFAALMLYPPLARSGRGLLDAAATLGANQIDRWRYVILPMIAPALGAVMCIVFCFTFGAFEIPFLLGMTYPRSLPVMAVERFISPELSDRPIAMVYNLVITLITGLVVWVYLNRIAPRLERGARE